MEITRLRQFCAVVETGSVRGAAEVLRISPGALSKALKVLQGDIGAELFVLSGRKLVLTDKGQSVYSLSTRLLQDYEDIRRESKRAVPDAIVRIGTFEVFSSYFLSEVLGSDLKDYRVRCLELVPGRIEEELLAKRIDLGITYVPVPNPQIDCLPVCGFHFGIFGRRDKFGGKPFADLPFAVPTTVMPLSPAQIRSLDGWPESRYPRKIRYELELLQTSLEIASQGLAVLYCPDFIVRAHNAVHRRDLELSRLPLPLGMKGERHTVYLLKRKSESEGPVAKKLGKATRRICKSDG